MKHIDARVAMTYQAQPQRWYPTASMTCVESVKSSICRAQRTHDILGEEGDEYEAEHGDESDL